MYYCQFVASSCTVAAPSFTFSWSIAEHKVSNVQWERSMAECELGLHDVGDTIANLALCEVRLYHKSHMKNPLWNFHQHFPAIATMEILE